MLDNTYVITTIPTVKSQKYHDLYYNSNSKITGGKLQKTYYAI